VLLLHGITPLDPGAPVVDLLAAHAKIVAPSHPGFGGSPRPAAFDTIYDLVHLYRDVLDHLPDETVTLLGLSFGGWLAAEIAALGHPRVAARVLVDAVGIKVGDRETPDILDLFNTAPSIVEQRTWHDPARWAPDYDAMSLWWRTRGTVRRAASTLGKGFPQPSRLREGPEATSQRDGRPAARLGSGSRAAGRARASPQFYSPAVSSTEGVGKGRRGAPCGARLSDHFLAGLSRLMASASV
jgi:pimeloyl-ACP methyl ester carboxylesterase